MIPDTSQEKSWKLETFHVISRNRSGNQELLLVEKLKFLIFAEIPVFSCNLPWAQIDGNNNEQKNKIFKISLSPFIFMSAENIFMTMFGSQPGYTMLFIVQDICKISKKSLQIG